MEIVKQPDFQVFASEAKTGEVLKFPDILCGWDITLEQTQGKPPDRQLISFLLADDKDAISSRTKSNSHVSVCCT